MTQRASAFPKKSFFLEMFTRDISLEDCVLDLIDNSIDSLIRTQSIVISANLLDPTFEHNGSSDNLPTIEITFTDRTFKIVDRCGGIPRKAALGDVFNFGHSKGSQPGYLGAYGIGLKRALFKIGNHFEIESKTEQEGFTTKLDVDKWSKRDNDIKDWTIPLKLVPGAKSSKQAGTSITITELRPEVRMRLESGGFERQLSERIAQAYALFIGRYVTVSLNRQLIKAKPFPIAESAEAQTSSEEFDENGVKVTLLSGLMARNAKGEWNVEKAGWYVLCNGRVVIAADKTNLTSWGEASPLFHHKYRGFIGVAFFQSDDPLALPWDTTKRGLNQEAPIYQRAKKRMSGLARPIITFLNNMYPSDPAAEPPERRIAEQIKLVDLRSLLTRPSTTFKPFPSGREKPRTVSIQFKAKIDDVNRIRKFLKEPSWGASRVVQYTFKHFLKTECPE